MTHRIVFKNRFLPYLLAAPQLVLMGVFFFYPALQAFLQSLFMEDAFGLSREFVGLENFAVLFADPAYPEAALRTLLFVAATTACSLALSLLLAWLLSQLRAGARFWHSALLWPYAVAPAVAGVLWMFLFNPVFGIVARALEPLGIEWNHVLDQGQAFFLICATAVWKQVPYNMLFFIVGIRDIPESLWEAAAVDGASSLRRFASIALPLLGPTFLYLLTMNLSFGFFDSFGIIHQITGGGPEQATTTLVYRVYRDGVLGLDFGSSSAQSIVLMTIVVALTALQFRFMERRITYA